MRHTHRGFSYKRRWVDGHVGPERDFAGVGYTVAGWAGRPKLVREYYRGGIATDLTLGRSEIARVGLATSPVLNQGRCGYGWSRASGHRGG
jgi:hypothetical protein